MTAFMELTVKATLILGVGLLALFALQRRSAAVRHWILASTLVCATAAPMVGLLTPSWSMAAANLPASRTGTAVDVSLRPATTSVSSAQTAAAPQSVSSRVGLDLLRAAVIPVWVLGIGANLSLLLLGVFRLARLRAAPALIEESIAESLQHISAIYRLRGRMMMVRSTRRDLILTWGFAKPVVVLPADVDEWPRARLEVVLAHEIAHIGRGDWAVQITAEVCKAIYWFNPLFWVACARMRHESERACDDVVMNLGVTSHVYATELLTIARSVGRHRHAWLPAPAIAARPSDLERRVRAMLNPHLDRGPITGAGRWASALALAAITVPIATFAQGGFVTFSGTVVDPQDRLLPGTTIIVADARRDVKHETKTDRNGRFELVGLPAGDYAFEAKRPGFRTLTDTFAVNGQSLDRVLKMQVSELQETISVTSDDGSITSAHQRGNAFARRPVACTDGGTSVGGNLRPPRKVKDVAPGYPGGNGNVQLVATIGTDGSVTDVQVVKADRPELVPSAIDAVRQWEFTPTLLNCIPIDVQMNVSIAFGQRK
jgi:beta-lactamase regulating signal transducer with metallopeptidase domain